MITLRTFEGRDVDFLVEYLNCEDVIEHLSCIIPQPYSPKDAEWWVNEGSRADIVRAIEVDGVLAGCIGAHRKHAEYVKSAEIGYWLGKPYWGQGIATFALKQLIPVVFESTDIVRLQAIVFEGNVASLSVLRKAGFVEEGYLRKAVYKNERFYNAHVFGKVVS